MFLLIEDKLGFFCVCYLLMVWHMRGMSLARNISDSQ